MPVRAVHLLGVQFPTVCRHRLQGCAVLDHAKVPTGIDRDPCCHTGLSRHEEFWSLSTSYHPRGIALRYLAGSGAAPRRGEGVHLHHPPRSEARRRQRRRRRSIRRLREDPCSGIRMPCCWARLEPIEASRKDGACATTEAQSNKAGNTAPMPTEGKLLWRNAFLRKEPTVPSGVNRKNCQRREKPIQQRPRISEKGYLRSGGEDPAALKAPARYTPDNDPASVGL